jgi:DNA-binding LacI/PurR family transcriptional regulator
MYSTTRRGHEQTRLKVEAAIAELGFVRNSAARALAARRTDTVGLVLPISVIPFSSTLLVVASRWQLRHG